mmetsp:Transcript_20293/g.30521  ORF Transcript_20293/g.30521 Transcript_20293/m.30521 type:complete len:132 (-) Transcript_20293:251-646(-)
MGCSSSKQATNVADSLPAEIDVSKGNNNAHDNFSSETESTFQSCPFRMDNLYDISKQYRRNGSVSAVSEHFNIEGSTQFTKRKSISSQQGGNRRRSSFASQQGGSKRRSSYAEKRESVRRKRLIKEVEYYW